MPVAAAWGQPSQQAHPCSPTQPRTWRTRKRPCFCLVNIGHHWISGQVWQQWDLHLYPRVPITHSIGQTEIWGYIQKIGCGEQGGVWLPAYGSTHQWGQQRMDLLRSHRLVATKKLLLLLCIPIRHGAISIMSPLVPLYVGAMEQGDAKFWKAFPALKYFCICLKNSSLHPPLSVLMVVSFLWVRHCLRIVVSITVGHTASQHIPRGGVNIT